MGTAALTDEALLAGGDPAAFERFYVKHVETLLGFFARSVSLAEAAGASALSRSSYSSSAMRRRPDRDERRRARPPDGRPHGRHGLAAHRRRAHPRRDGAVIASTPMPIFGATGLPVVGDEVWVGDAGGRTLVLSR